jgi:hypothetical protein
MTGTLVAHLALAQLLIVVSGILHSVRVVAGHTAAKSSNYAATLQENSQG